MQVAHLDAREAIISEGEASAVVYSQFLRWCCCSPKSVNLCLIQTLSCVCGFFFFLILFSQ